MSYYSYYLLAFAKGQQHMQPSSLNPRKAPRQARAQITHDAILEAATHIIGRGGLTAFNTNAVAERAGVSIGSLYQYFPNKDALMVALIHKQQRTQLTNVQSALAGLADVDFETAVRTLVRAAMQHHRDDTLLATALDHEEARLPLSDILADYLNQGGETLAILFHRYRDQIGAIDPTRATRTIPALVKAAVDCWANNSPPELDIAEDEAVRAVLGYLCIGG
jgi:AcrR family transcriptional regulator